MQSFSLHELLSTVSLVLSDAFPDRYRVRAEVSSLSARDGGHCYMELIESGGQPSAVIARVRANCWRQTWAELSRSFVEVTGQSLKPGMQVLAEVSVEIHPVYGMSLTIHDIDPTFSLGDIARRRLEDIRRLEAAGLTTRQQQLAMPLLPQCIAVISSATAAGYQDFVHQLETNSAGYAFSLTLFEALMQGDSAASSIADALARIRQSGLHFDAVAVIRGGGATADLSCFDDYALAAQCAVFPLPVLTGIGHTRDVTLVDMVAWRSLKTPTAVAEFLLSLFDGQTVALDDLSVRLARTATRLTLRLGTQAEQYAARARAACIQRLKHERLMLDMTEKDISRLSPEYIFRKGYALVRRGQEVVRSSADVRSGDRLTIEWLDGKVVMVKGG